MTHAAKPKTVLDLFSGIGGFSYAAHKLGWQTAAFCERDQFCQQVLAKNFPGIPIYDDVYTLNIDNVVNACYDMLDVHQRQEIDMAANRKDYDQAVKMYEQGLSIGDVAAFYQVSRQAMWAILKRRGCVFRSHLRYGEDNHFYRGTQANDRAQNICENAIKKGILIRPSLCETCGEPSQQKNGRSGIQAHHCDYNKPLEVMWLCQKCHHQWHQENQAIPFQEVGFEEVNRLCSVEVLTGGFP